MDYIKQRVLTLADYICEQNATVREAAKRFGVSKSTVHKDVSERLETISPYMYSRVRRVLDKNKAERHIRGGQATKLKFEKLKKHGL